MNYSCCTDTRRNAVKDHPTLNGIDYLEVLDELLDPYQERQTTLYLHFLNARNINNLTAANIIIKGGERIQHISVVEVSPELETAFPLSPPDEVSTVLAVKVDQAGDFSTYTLSLVKNSQYPDEPPGGFDPILSSVDFSFKVNCPNDFDCQPVHACPPPNVTPPEINYLAKDYASFRQLMLDRMALLAPDWKERNSADLGIVLVELLAYTADYLSYQQDAIATEAYLGTARKRVSVRRHARLVDYFMHDGCNARTWLQIELAEHVNGLTLKKESVNRILTKVKGLPSLLPLNSPEYEKALASGVKVFELMRDPNPTRDHDIVLYAVHNKMHFHTWGRKNCCLPKGATGATLKNHFPNLKIGDVLILAEVLGPETGLPQDADPTRRHAVKLTDIKYTYDPLFSNKDASTPASPTLGSPFDSLPQGSPLVLPLSVSSPPKSPLYFSPLDSPPLGSPLDSPLSVFSPPESPIYFSPPASPPPGSPPLSPPLANLGLPVTEIKWDKQDALPFPLCISSHQVEDVSVAWGNIVLVDHGLTITDKTESSLSPDKVPASNLVYANSSNINTDFCQTKHSKALPLRYNPKLLIGPLTYAAPYDSSKSASALLRWSMRSVIPAIWLTEGGEKGDKRANPVWNPQRDLLNSASTAKEFVVETETDGISYLRFGDNKQGERPESEVEFKATYRIGNGKSGNIGADALAHLATDDVEIINNIIKVWNPLPAKGGMEAETMEEVRQFAPEAFRTQERAVTPADYELFAQKCDLDVQRAAATFRWTGSWKTVFLSADRLGGLNVDADFEKDLRNCLEKYRMAGFDLEVDMPIYISLEIEMAVCVNPNFLASHVKQALLELFSNQILADGRKGIFHPDNFSFGQPVYLSKLYAVAQSAQGVDSVQIKKFQRQGKNSSEALEKGKLTLERREIARCDNDRNFPEHGVFNLIMKGGRA